MRHMSVELKPPVSVPVTYTLCKMTSYCNLPQVTELECVSAQANAIKSHKTELNQTIEELEATLKAKEEVRKAVFFIACFLHV